MKTISFFPRVTIIIVLVYGSKTIAQSGSNYPTSPVPLDKLVGNVYGTVMDKITSEPVAGAKVLLFDEQTMTSMGYKFKSTQNSVANFTVPDSTLAVRSGVTSADGGFLVNSVPTPFPFKYYSIVIIADGYVPLVVAGARVFPGAVMALKVNCTLEKGAKGEAFVLSASAPQVPLTYRDQETVLSAPFNSKRRFKPEGIMYAEYATREGLVGGTTANGHVIVQSDYFASLPNPRVLCSNGGSEFQIKVMYYTNSATVPVWDVGPWNTDDDYWNYSTVRQAWNDLSRGTPEAEAAYNTGYNGGHDQFGRTVTNPSGIDLADGTFLNDLGMTNNDWVTIDFLWSPDVKNGDNVQATSALNVRSTPGGVLVGTEASGGTGVIVDGPQGVSYGSRFYVWWKIQWQDGSTGWCVENYIQKVTVSNVQVAVQTSPSGMSFTVDEYNYSSSQPFTWQSGSLHTIGTTTPQSGGTGIQYLWTTWSDGGTINHSISPTTNLTYTANFTIQYYLTMTGGQGGVSPSSGWYNSGQSVQISATPNSGYTFTGWQGSGLGSYTGLNNPATITMNGPITESASFTVIPTSCFSLTTNVTPSGAGSITVNTPQNCSGGYAPNTQINLTASPQSGFSFAGWTGSGGTFSNSSSSATTFTIASTANITANFSSGSTVTVTSPSAGATWTVGKFGTVVWSSTGSVGNVNIKLSTDGGNTFPLTLAANIVNAGTESVAAPNSVSSSCRIRVEAARNSSVGGINPGDFTIGKQEAASGEWQVVDTVQIPSVTYPFHIAVGNGKAYIGSQGGKLMILDLSTNTVTSQLAFPQYPTAIPAHMSMSGSQLYVALSNLVSGEVAVVNMASDSVSNYIPVGTTPFGIAWLNDHLYVTDNVWWTNGSPATVYLVDLSTDTIIGSIPVGINPSSIAIDAATGKAYVTNNNAQSNSVSVISTSSNTVTKTILMPGQPVDVSVLGGCAYVTYDLINLNGGVAIIDIASDSLTSSMAVGGDPNEIASFSNFIFVANQSSNTVSVIDADKDSLVATLDVGNGPSGIAADPNAGKVYVVNQRDSSINVIEQIGPTKVRQTAPTIPKGYQLLQAYPNPFNPTTKIGYDIPEASFVRLVVYDILGRQVQTLVNEEKQPGSYSVQFDGASVPSGVYFYRIIAGKFSDVRKMILMK